MVSCHKDRLSNGNQSNGLARRYQRELTLWPTINSHTHIHKSTADITSVYDDAKVEQVTPIRPTVVYFYMSFKQKYDLKTMVLSVAFFSDSQHSFWLFLFETGTHRRNKKCQLCMFLTGKDLITDKFTGLANSVTTWSDASWATGHYLTIIM